MLLPKFNILNKVKKERTITLANALIIAFAAFVVFTVLQTLGIVNLFLLGYTVCSWIGIFIFSVMITWCFNAQPNIVRFCITILILGLFLFLHTTLARTKPNVISYMNALGLAIFVSFIICFIYIFPFSSKNSNEKTQNKELDKPQSLIIAIYQGRYNTRNDLFRFYTNYTSKKDTFIDLLNVICEVCIESINNQDLSQIIKERCQKVYSVVKPILEEEKEVEYLMNVTGKERDSLMFLHNSSKKLDVSKQEAVIRHLSIIADSIIITKNKLTEENNRNTQSLTLSMIGIILTILFSLLSLLSAENFSALHIYMDYIKWFYRI